jgi:hypothetical protein
MKNDQSQGRMRRSGHRGSQNHSAILTGSTADKHPVILDGGKTIIFVDDKSMETETRNRYELRKK